VLQRPTRLAAVEWITTVDPTNCRHLKIRWSIPGSQGFTLTRDQFLAARLYNLTGEHIIEPDFNREFNGRVGQEKLLWVTAKTVASQIGYLERG